MTVSMETKISEATSLAQTQELIMTIFSCVGYLRDLFPEESFQEHRIAGMNLKKFKKSQNGSSDSDKLLQWIEEGCFDAISKKYLKSAVLTILADTTSPNNVLETYTLRINYPDSVLHQTIDSTTATIAQLSLTRNNQPIVAVESSPSNFREAISKILRNLCVMSQTLKSLPMNKYLSMKLSYYEEVTPQSYEPPGFVAAEFDIDYLFQGSTSKYSFGKVGTPFHGLGLSMETICDDTLSPNSKSNSTSQAPNVQSDTYTYNNNDNNNSDSPIINTVDVQEGINFNESLVIASQVAQASNSAPNFPPSQQEINENDNFVNNNKEKSKAIIPSHPNPEVVKKHPPIESKSTFMNSQKLQIIKCSCNFNVKDLEMLQCDSCLYWQHAVCQGYVSCRDRRLENAPYLCYHCRFGRQVQTFNFLQKLSLFRKALAVLSAEGFDQSSTFGKRLGISKYVAVTLRTRLVQEGFLVVSDTSKYKYLVAKKDENIKEKIKKYFNQNLEVHDDFIQAQKWDNRKVNKRSSSSEQDKLKDKECLDNDNDNNSNIDDIISSDFKASSSTVKKPIPFEIISNTAPFEIKEGSFSVNLPVNNGPEPDHQITTSSTVDKQKPLNQIPSTPIQKISSSAVNINNIITPPPTIITTTTTPLQKKRKISTPSSRITCYLNNNE